MASDASGAPVPLLSVIIPVRNGARDLGNQLEALSDQVSEIPSEIIVVDNGSTDGSADVAETYRAKIPGLELVDASECAGQAYALNAGAAIAKGRSLVLLDADDLVAPGYLAAMGRALESSAFVAARMDCDSLNSLWLRASRPPTQTDGIGAPFGFLPSAAGCSIGVRRSTFESVGGFDTSILLGTDVDFCWRVQLRGVPLTYVADAVVRYRYRDTLRGIFSQARSYGTAGPTLYKRYRSKGMPRRSWRAAGRFHAAAFARLLAVRSKSDLAGMVFLLGFRLGIIEGCVSRRVCYL